MSTYRIRSLIFMLFTLSVIFYQGSSFSQTKTPKKVAVLPFTMNADRDLSFLQEGIVDMLGSRLAWKGEVDIIQKGLVKDAMARFAGPVNRETALEIGKALGADYVILGSLTMFGDSVSMDARILDVNRSEDLVSAFNQSRGMNEVIPTVNKFAEDINEKIMGRVIQPRVQAGAPTAPAALPRGPGGLVGEEKDDFAGQDEGYAQRFRFEIMSMDAGDVDGDGNNELVLVTKRQIYIYKIKEKRFQQIKVFEAGWSPNYIYASAADLNQNGKAEIYVTDLEEVNVSSYVYEWSGGQFEKIAEAPGWFLRVTNLPGKGKTVIGQRRESGKTFHGKVQIMIREGTQFVPAGPLELTSFGNIYNFAIGELGKTKTPYTVLTSNHDEKLRVYDTRGERIWMSEEYFGGNPNFIENPKNESMNYESTITFMPSPIYITDVDEDGEREVMVCKNVEKGGRFLARGRYYTSGKLHFMTMGELGLATKWITKKMQGFIVGYLIIDIDGDGLQELIIASVSKEETAFDIAGRGRSHVVVFDLK